MDIYIIFHNGADKPFIGVDTQPISVVVEDNCKLQ